MAFPCYDEPRFRATFNISITHGAAYNALSNMPVKEVVSITEETVKTVFATTPPIPTYTVAFAVSDFVYLENSTVTPVQRTYAPQEFIEGTRFALETGVKAMAALKEYLGVPYTLPKMDQFSITPFKSMVMENWGLVAYASPNLHFSADDTPTEIAHTVDVICHEMAHQWFGNLVTLDWRDFLWLNEGFATLMATEIAESIYPDLNIADLF